AAMVVLGLAAVGLLLGSVLLWREQVRTQAALAEAKRQQRLARKVVDEMYTEVAEAWLSEQPGLQPLQRKFLQKALEFYQQLAEEDGNDPAIERETALAYRRVADIQLHLGQFAEAEEGYTQAVRRRQKLAADSADAPEHIQELAVCRHRLGILLMNTGRQQAAEEAFQKALDLEEKLVADCPQVPKYREDLAVHYSNRAILYMKTGAMPAAERAYVRA